MTRLRDLPPSAINRLWGAYLILTVAAFAFASSAGAGVQAGVGAILGLASVAAVVAGATVFDAQPRRPWMMLAAGQLCFALGDVAAVVQPIAAGAPLFPSARGSCTSSPIRW